MNTKAVEDYVKAIYQIGERGGGSATVSQIAEHLGVTPASVTGMVKKLAELRLVRYEPYKPIELTPAGLKIALEVVRHHRLIELFLAEALGVPWDEVHAEAEQLEHVISEALEDRIDAALGFPKFDPHGDPIPARDGRIEPRTLQPLVALGAGAEAVVARVSDRSPEILRYLGELGLYPGTPVKVLRAEPFDGPLTLRVGSEPAYERVVGNRLAREIDVMPVLEEA